MSQPSPSRALPIWEYARGFLLLGIFAGTGWAVVYFSHLPFPPPLVGLALAGMALRLGLIRLEWIETSGTFLLRHMSLFFLPILLGATHQIPAAPEARIAVALAAVGGTILTFWTTQALSERWMPKEPDP